jgi:arabinogalactan endo-1,4-beta-galactosidase
MVQVGNEIAPGMLWPDGKVIYKGSQQEQDESWQRFGKLFNAGARAVREASSASHPIKVVIHIHGGGHQGLPKWFFSKFNPTGGDYDVIALSYYPGPKENFDDLKQNLADVGKLGKDVLIAEVAYPWKPTDEPQDANQRWALTREGQAQFVRDLMNVVRNAPDDRVLGVVWWYPEAIPVKGLTIWKSGAMALFDEQGNALPALDAFGKTSP